MENWKTSRDNKASGDNYSVLQNNLDLIIEQVGLKDRFEGIDETEIRQFALHALTYLRDHRYFTPDKLQEAVLNEKPELAEALNTLGKGTSLISPEEVGSLFNKLSFLDILKIQRISFKTNILFEGKQLEHSDLAPRKSQSISLLESSRKGHFRPITPASMEPRMFANDKRD